MRKVVQIATTTLQVGSLAVSNLVVLCDDGVLLQYSPRSTPPWTRFPAVPGPEVDLPELNPHLLPTEEDQENGPLGDEKQ